MKMMAADPATQRFEKFTDPMQEGLPTRRPGEWWADIEDVFHID